MQQQRTISQSVVICDKKWIFMWQPAQWMDWEPTPNLHRSWSLVACSQSDPLQLSESWWNHYIGKVRSANWWDAPKTATPAAGTGQQKGPQSPQCTLHNQHFKSWTNWAMKYCLICHIQLTSLYPTTTSSSISITFCRQNASTTSRRQKMLSKSSSNPKACIFKLQA